MITFIALLRGINVNGQKKIEMGALREMMNDLGFKGVNTYIQSGNIVFKAKESDSKTFQINIKQQIENKFGHEVPVLVLSSKELTRIIERNPYHGDDAFDQKQLYYIVLFNKPDQERIAALNNESFDGERFVIIEDCIYLYCQNGYGNAKLNNNLLERKLKVTATTRNHRTMLRLLDMANTVS
jgi:uncharacterized protein (DUF1697 family)